MVYINIVCLYWKCNQYFYPMFTLNRFVPDFGYLVVGGNNKYLQCLKI